MTGNVYDEASPITPSRITQLKAAGAAGVCRYLKLNLPNSYNLTQSERALILGSGLPIWYNAEQSAGDMINESPSYWLDYGLKWGSSLTAWGVPLDRGVSVVASCDDEVSTTQLAKVIGNYAAFKQGLGGYEIRGYAQTQVIDSLFDAQLVSADSKHWLPSAIGWSGSAYKNADGSWNWAKYLSYPHAGIVQRLATDIGGTDENTVIDLAGCGLEYPPGMWPASTKEDEEMQLAGWAYRAQDGGLWIVSPDFSTKTAMGDALDWGALFTSGYFLAPPAGFDDADLANIPTATALSTLMQGVIDACNNVLAATKDNGQGIVAAAGVVAALPDQIGTAVASHLSTATGEPVELEAAAVPSAADIGKAVRDAIAAEPITIDISGSAK